MRRPKYVLNFFFSLSEVKHGKYQQSLKFEA